MIVVLLFNESIAYNRFKCENAPGWNNISWLQTVDHVVEASKRRTPVCITI